MTLLTSILAFAAASGAPATQPVDSYANISFDCGATTVLPEPKGPHQVGRSDFFFVDQDREERRTADLDDLRQVTMTLWYPAKRIYASPPAAYMPSLESFLGGFAADARPMLRTIGEGYRPLACVVGHAYANESVSDLAATFPVIVFSPGGTMSRYWYSSLAQHWASDGYVVAVIGHAHSGTDVFPRDGLHFDPLAWRAPEGATQAEAEALEEELTETLAQDAIFVLNRMADIQEGTLAHALIGRLDLERVALVGHSRGGSTVTRGCRSDARFDACVIFDNIGDDKDVKEGLKQPQLIIRTPWNEQRETALARFLERNPRLAMDAVFSESSHMSFSDLPIVTPEQDDDSNAAKDLSSRIANLTLHFLDEVWEGGPGEFAKDRKLSAKITRY